MQKKVNILVVDDNPTNLKLVGNVLKEVGYRLSLALDGPNAMKILEQYPIDLILLDIMMPGIDGFTVCQRLKESKAFRDIPIIFLTARDDLDDVVRGFELGGVDYITKPFRKEELLVRVNNHVKLKLMSDFLAQEVKRHKENRNQYMNMLLEFGKSLERKKA
ncbi:MAG: response regulator [Bacteroidales bacterium]